MNQIIDSDYDEDDSDDNLNQLLEDDHPSMRTIAGLDQED